ncbi:hypothetical protein [Celeribacter litoreus]|uniref:hypothetical protein n=1 Tax=Celeribacter litoreus TaxID=2876714 RepID=UPI001CCC0187|nr:hypothetical protein [Celeribacter litoreus]MCA0041989.1 hypothetical protein [Celeribacter litoreus]
MLRPSLLSALVLGIAGCSASDTTGDQSRQAAYESYNVARESAYEDASQGAALGTAALNNLAASNSTASMAGAYEMVVASLLSDPIVGEMTMNADFGKGTVKGNLSNSYIDGSPGAHTVDDVAVLTGTVSYSGTIDNDPDVGDAQVVAHGDGIFTDADTGTGYDLYLDIDGNFYRYGAAGELIGVTGGFEGNIDVTTDGSAVLYDIDGDFVVCENTCVSE